MKVLNVFIERLPEIGGASGAVSASMILITWESVLAAIISAFIFSIVGGTAGYFLKMLLDRLLKKKKM